MTPGLLLEVVTPERMVVAEEIEELTAPGAEGEFGVLPGHIPFLVALKIGMVSYRKGGNKHFLAISQGVAEITPNKATLLVETAEKAEEIDLERAQAAKLKAEEKLKGLKREDQEFPVNQEALERALTRILVAGKRKQ